MSAIVKEKNYLKIETAKGTRFFDINTGKFCSLKDLNKPVKIIPTGIKDIVLSQIDSEIAVVAYMQKLLITGCNYSIWGNKQFSVVDRLQAIGYDFNNFREWLTFDTINYNSDKIDKHFKSISKYLLNNPNTPLSVVIDEVSKAEYLKENNLDTDPRLTDEMKNWLYANKFENENLKLARISCYIGLYDFIDDYTLVDNIKNYQKMCSEMEIEMKIDKDFPKNYSVVKMSYTAWKEKEKNNIIAKFYDDYKEKLLFENEDLMIVLPEKTDDFVKEGNTMGNCVGTWGLRHVADKDFHIVFIRRKTEPEKPYIDCEVELSGYIGQYYEHCNRSPKAEEAIKFKKEYAKFLRNSYNK